MKKQFVCECGAVMKLEKSEPNSGWGSYDTYNYYKCPECGKEELDVISGPLTPSGERAKYDRNFAKNFYR